MASSRPGGATFSWPPGATVCQFASAPRAGNLRPCGGAGTRPPYNSSLMYAPRAQLKLGEDGLSLEWRSGASWGLLTLVVRFQDGGESRSAAWSQTGTGGDGYRAEVGPLRAELSLPDSSEPCQLNLKLRSSKAIAVREVEISGNLTLPGSNGRWLLYNGYQSWDRS